MQIVWDHSTSRTRSEIESIVKYLIFNSKFMVEKARMLR